LGADRAELLLLGVPRLLVGGAEAILPTRKALGLLAYLALEGKTSRERMAAILWSDWPGQEARRNLRQELYRLQRSAAAPFLRAGPAALELGPGLAVDVLQFRAELAEGAVEAALARWRGPFLDGLEVESPLYEEWAERRRTLLRDQRLSAMARRAAMLEGGGAAKEALRAWIELLAENELDEAAQRSAMRLHYRLGEREAALLRYQRYAKLLRDELGADPLPETSHLASRIRASAALEAPRAPPRAPSMRLDLPLVEREELRRAVEGAPGLALITGEPGTGKTRLATELAASHPPFLVVRGDEVFSGTPLYPFAVAIREAFASPEARRLIEALDPLWRREAARLVPEVSGLDPGPPEPEGRATFLEGLARVVAAAVAGGTLIVDDLQWLDATSVELVLHLVAHGDRFRILGAARTEGLDGESATARALERLEREGRLARFVLPALTPRGVRELVQTLSGTDAALFSARLHRATGGNPLFVRETLHALFASGELRVDPGGTWSTPYDDETSDYGELPIPETVRGAVLGRVDRLGPEVRRLLEAASLAGERFGAESLAGATALSDLVTLDGLERAQAAQLLRADPEVGEAGGSPPRPFRFDHELVRRSLAEGLSLERRRLLHAKLAEAAAARHARPQEIARHLEEAGRAREASALRVRAAEAAVRVYANREALLQYDRALADGVDPATAFRIHAARVELLRFVDDAGERLRALEAMAELAGQLGDPARHAELAMKLSVHHHETDRLDLALQVSEEALQRWGGLVDPVTRAALALEVGASLAMMGRFAEAEARLGQVLEPTREASPLKHANACYWLAHCESRRGDPAAARRHLDAAIAGTEAVGYRRGHAMALRARAGLRIDAGDFTAGVADFEAAWAEVRAIGNLDLLRGMAEELRELSPGLPGEARDRVAAWLDDPALRPRPDQGAVVKEAASDNPTAESSSSPASPRPRSGEA
jgi:DNA-binding SARP family transcriptional activator